MNQACEKCGRIVTIPDIPLPPGYTQKCTACGFANRVASDLDQLTPSDSLRGYSEESWEASFASTLDIDSSNKTVTNLDDRLRDIEHRLRDEMERRFAGQSVPARDSDERPRKVVHHMVSSQKLLIATRNTVMYQKCYGILSDQGYSVEGAGELEKALHLMKRSHYGVVVLDQQFLVGDLGRQIFKHIMETPPAIRRAQIIALITPAINSCESQVFYQWGMDLNIHPRDLDRFGLLLEQVIGEKEYLLAPLVGASYPY